MRYLTETVWTHPDSYAGFSPDGDYCILSRHRDSDLLDESNWQEACKRFNAEAWDNGAEGYDSRPLVYHWRAGHCLVGWVEYLMVRQDAPADLLARAESMLKALDGYPILNEDDFCEREFFAACDYWESLTIADRLQALSASGSDASMFAARRPELPSDNGSLQDYLTRY